MPYPDKKCHVCGDFITNNNFRRHMRRWHPDMCPEEDAVSQSAPSRDPSPAVSVQSRSKSDDFADDLTPDYVRNATMCMLRRQEGNNIPSMSRYLATFFPSIPPFCRMPLIVATFTAAQKVAATHGDTLLPGDDERIGWARRSLARWTHGLSGVEPDCTRSRDSSTDRSVIPEDDVRAGGDPVTQSSEHNRASAAPDVVEETSRFLVEKSLNKSADTVGLVSVDSEQPPLKNSEILVPTTAFLEKLLLPVPIDSVFAQRDAQTAFANVTSNSSTAEASATGSTNRADGVIIKDMSLNIDALLPDQGKDTESDSTAVADCSSPVCFADLLAVETEDPSEQERLLRPLSVLLTPISTPKTVPQRSGDGVVTPEEQSVPVIRLFASPNPSLEEDLTPILSKNSTHQNERLSAVIRQKPQNGMSVVKKTLKNSEDKENSVSASSQQALEEAGQNTPQGEASKKAGDSRDKELLNKSTSRDGEGVFRIPLKSRTEVQNVRRNLSDRRPKSLISKAGEKRRNDLSFDRGANRPQDRFDKYPRSSPSSTARDWSNTCGNHRGYPRSFDRQRQRDDFRRQLSRQELEWLERMPRRFD